MTSSVADTLREQLEDRRHRLRHAIDDVGTSSGEVQGLLETVDATLARLYSNFSQICEECRESIDPLVRFCLDQLDAQERDALEQDLQLAARIQNALLPPRNLAVAGWKVAYHYQPAGVVSGDYVDIVDGHERGLYFMLGDVSGKGIAASMLMNHLHAMFRTLISVGLPLKAMIEHASRIFSQSTLPTHYATLVLGRAEPGGKIEVVNAGHLPPLVVRNGITGELAANGLPLGMFNDEEFTVGELTLNPGDNLIAYSDGFSEATNDLGEEYGRERLRTLIASQQRLDTAGLISAARDDLSGFASQGRPTDDVTLLVLHRAAL